MGAPRLPRSCRPRRRRDGDPRVAPENLRSPPAAERTQARAGRCAAPAERLHAGQVCAGDGRRPPGRRGQSVSSPADCRAELPCERHARGTRHVGGGAHACRPRGDEPGRPARAQGGRVGPPRLRRPPRLHGTSAEPAQHRHVLFTEGAPAGGRPHRRSGSCPRVSPASLPLRQRPQGPGVAEGRS